MTPLINPPSETPRTPFSGASIDEKLYSLAREEVLLKVPIHDYFRRYIDYEVDLDMSPKCLCPFHDEDTPSFRYRADLEYWNCFGCKKGGTVIDLHMYTVGFKNYYEALWDLKERYGDVYGLKFKNFFISKKNKDLTLENLIAKKETVMSLDEFLDTSSAKSITIVQDDIEKELAKLKSKHLDSYIKACMKYDNMKSLLTEDIEEFEKILDFLVRLNTKLKA